MNRFPTIKDSKNRLIAQGRELNKKIARLGLQNILWVEVDVNQRVPFAVKRKFDNETVWGGINRDITEAFIYGVYARHNDFV